MKILMAHARYRMRGGEDESTDLEVEMLRRHGHEVATYFRDNRELEGRSKGRVAVETIWNSHAYRAIARLIATQRPDIVHVQNTFPLLSPSIIRAAKNAGIPVVQSLRNYRLLCVNAMMLRDGLHCEKCVGASPFAGVRHGCYRKSRTASAVVAAMLLTHRSLGTWSRSVTRYIATSEFTRQKYIQGGFDPDAIAVKPNMLHPDPGEGDGSGNYVLFVGRLSEEKGISSLLSAWRLRPRSSRLLIAGEGPLEASVKREVMNGSGVEWLGRRRLGEILELMGGARAVVVPSEWHEPFGRVVVESFAKGTPVIASRTGALPELVSDRSNGWLFPAGDIQALSRALHEATSDRDLGIMRSAARSTFEQRYTDSHNHDILLRIYESAIKQKDTRSVRP